MCVPILQTEAGPILPHAPKACPLLRLEKIIAERIFRKYRKPFAGFRPFLPQRFFVFVQQ
ncbi:hypothetical protein UF14_12455 [Bacillus licheniformis]|nr:hypothetical protein UF14_12455 [Bacillus licheniformis]